MIKRNDVVSIKKEFRCLGSRKERYVVLRVWRYMLLVRPVRGGLSFTYPVDAFEVCNVV